MAIITVHQATPDDATELARLLDLFDTMGATFIGELDGQGNRSALRVCGSFHTCKATSHMPS